jgi:ParB family chromosome partitioning protein
MNRIVLGRGIGALIPDGETTGAQAAGVNWSELPIAKIRPNPHQPRHDLDQTKLAELSESIRQDGVLQPVLVRAKGEEFELIAGERRLRAAHLAGLSHIPARIFEHVDEKQQRILALVENLQREDLNALEEAAGYRELQEQHGLSQEELAAAVGKDRSTVANMLRILNLPESVRAAVSNGTLTAGHGRALLSLVDSDQIEKTAKRAIRDGWSVRKLEREISGDAPRRGRPIRSAQRHPWSAVEDAMKRKFGTQVTISQRLGKGKIVFEYYSEEDLTRLVDLFEVRLD